MLRHVSQNEIGVTNVRLLLLESTVLFLSREAFRRACLTDTVHHNWSRVINLIWLSYGVKEQYIEELTKICILFVFRVPLCACICGVCGYIWLRWLSQPDISVTVYYDFGVWSILISCIIELCCEQLYIVAQAFLFVKLQVFKKSILQHMFTVHVLHIIELCLTKKFLFALWYKLYCLYHTLYWVLFLFLHFLSSIKLYRF